MPDPLTTPYLTGNSKNGSPVKTQTLKGQCAQKSSRAYNWIADTFYYCHLNKWFKGNTKKDWINVKICMKDTWGFCFKTIKNTFTVFWYQRASKALRIHKYSWTWRISSIPQKHIISFNVILQGITLYVLLFILYKDNPNFLLFISNRRVNNKIFHSMNITVFDKQEKWKKFKRLFHLLL